MKYVSPNQLTLEGFETPFEQKLTQTNRWVTLSKLIPWDTVVNRYNSFFKSTEGRPPINGRIVVGAIIIKHTLNITDEETILQIQENMFMQYFLGYSSFTNEAPFDSSLFVDIRKKLDEDFFSSISVMLMQHHGFIKKESVASAQTEPDKTNEDDLKTTSANDGIELKADATSTVTNTDLEEHNDVVENKKGEDSAAASVVTIETINKGKLLLDATVCPQDITYPTDLKLLDASRMKSEKLIDIVYKKAIGYGKKPRTYRKNARKAYLTVIKNKNLSFKKRYRAISEQLHFLKRNLGHLQKLIGYCKNQKVKKILKPKDEVYLQTISKVYAQQLEMHTQNKNSVADRIVNIHQPYVRPMPRGKAKSKTEFGAKIHVSLIEGFAIIDHLDWNSFNEANYLQSSVEGYKKKFGYYPKEIHVDQIYGNRDNRAFLKKHNIVFKGKALGRPSKNLALSNQVSPGERNPVEGKFGQAKRKYGLDRIRAKLKDTSESWIGSIILVLNLARLARLASVCLYHIYQYIRFKMNVLKAQFKMLNYLTNFNGV